MIKMIKPIDHDQSPHNLLKDKYLDLKKNLDIYTKIHNPN